MKVQMRLRAPEGMVRLEVEENATLKHLVELITEKTELRDFTLKYGWPLRALDLSPGALNSTVTDLKLRGETIVVVPPESTPTPVAEPAAATKKNDTQEKVPFKAKRMEPDETVVEFQERGGFVVLRVMPDDNSCMFTSVGGAIPLPDPASKLRQQVADYILAHPEEYTKVILGDDPENYVRRMKQSDTWGGAIELSILSDIYKIQICSIDVKSLRVDQFGENMDTRCIIVYSGIHYDRIAFTMDISHPVEFDITQWSTEDDEILVKAKVLCEKLQKLHYFTDTTDFVIKCEVCNWIGQGARDITQHKKETGHDHYGELQIQ